MERESRLGKRKFLFAVRHGPYDTGSWDCEGTSKIQKETVCFRFGVKHRKRSTRPVGTIREAGWYDSTVKVVFAHTKSLGYYAPNVEFALRSDIAHKLMVLILKALTHGNLYSMTPERLIEATGALFCEQIGDRSSCDNDYQVLGVPGESPLQTLARQAD
jgi:hypothetical protein